MYTHGVNQVCVAKALLRATIVSDYLAGGNDTAVAEDAPFTLKFQPTYPVSSNTQCSEPQSLLVLMGARVCAAAGREAWQLQVIC
jgi:hypothetical protein